MKKLLLICLSITFLCGSIVQAEVQSYDEFNIKGPYTYNNLSLYLVKTQPLNNDIEVITLSEAINSGKIKILETGNVQELSLENKCGQPIYIQSGDIVKGGQQDRVIRFDLVIYPTDKKLALKSFCVESNRWNQRDNESVSYFSSSEKIVTSKELKLAAKMKESQTEVWEEVDNMQTKLSDNLGVAVRSGRSSSSLQLALENETVMKQSKKYMSYFNDVVSNEKDVVGFIFTISNKINSGDIYHSPDLFQKMYPKMIEAASIEALSGIDIEYKSKVVTVDEIIAWLKDAKSGEITEKKINDNTFVKITETESTISFDTFDKRFGENWIHKNLIKK